MSQQPTHPTDQRTKAHFRPVWITTALLLITVSATIFFFRESHTPTFFPGNILVLTLLQLNLILFVLLVLLLSRNLIKHYFERRRQILGTGFRGKLIAAFVGFSSIPAILLLIVASGLLTSSVENWFSIQVERPLENALSVAQTYYQKEEDSARRFAATLSASLSKENFSSQAERVKVSQYLESKRKEYGVAGLEIYSLNESAPLRTFDRKIPEAIFAPPPEPLFKKSFAGETVVEKPLTTAGNLIRVMTPIRPADTDPVKAVLLVDILIPETLGQKMEAISHSFEDYKQLKAFKNPIKESYLLSFVLITMVILFSATWFGFYLAKGITGPIQRLADGTRAVAQGDLSFRIRVKATDELGILVDSFNKMTEDLQAGKEQLEEVNRSLRRSNLELDQRRIYIETVLQNIATGMVSLDTEGRITAVNYAAERIFQIGDRDILGKLAKDAFEALKLSPLIVLLGEMEQLALNSIEREIHLEVGGRALTLNVNLTWIRNDDGKDMGKVVVVEDLTELIKAEKAAAWKEVAQNIAHEIKNPLTPIQLSAQRVRKKFLENAPDFPSVLEESTTTIMNEVRSLKHLVDEFSLFARLPSPRFNAQDIHGIIQEVIQLYKGAHRDLKVETRFSDSLPKLSLDREQFRRVFVNLFENAIDAVNRAGTIWITTRHEAGHKKAIIMVEDDGCGILQEDMDKLFLPYFSRKKTGTGLGLAIVHRIVKEHNGNIRIRNRNPRGTQVSIELPA